jgi:hypothetical protein
VLIGILVAAVALLAIAAIGGVLVVQRSDRTTAPVAAGPTTAGERDEPGAATDSTTTPAPASASPTTAPSSAVPPTAASTRPGAVGGPLLLWPFTSEQQALQWEQSYREGGHQPWHADPCSTGQQFVQSVLGFTEITQVASCQISGEDAWVTVGYDTPDRIVPTGATVHLVRLGHQPGGWTVVGSRDPVTLTLTTPRYGALVEGQVHLAGQVSGLGEDILTVRIIDLSGHTVGTAPNRLIGLGGPWQADIQLPDHTDQVLIAVASTDSGLGPLADLAITAIVMKSSTQ